MPKTIATARKLRRNSTDAEKAIWQKLRNSGTGFKFKRQQPVGRFVVDFFCQELKLAMEVDGGQHAESESDKSRTAWLEKAGILVIRYWNNEVLSNIEGVMEDLSARLAARKSEIAKG